MKNLILISVVAFSLSACNQAEVDNSNRQKDSLVSVINQRDSALNEVLNTFNDVERNLDSVAIKQHIISTRTDKQGELTQTSKERINAEIASINELMDQNRAKIAELNRKLKSSGNKNVVLEKTIATLNEQLTKKDQELVELNAKLAAANVQVAQLQTSVQDLTVQNNEKSQNIAEKTVALHTAYYIIGKSKDLEEAKLIDRKGGLLGIGKTAKLNSDVDNSKFTRIDYTQMSNIAINSKDIKIVTSHASDSYRLDKDAKDKDKVTNLVITNPEKFWSSSKYLVISKD